MGHGSGDWLGVGVAALLPMALARALNVHDPDRAARLYVARASSVSTLGRGNAGAGGGNLRVWISAADRGDRAGAGDDVLVGLRPAARVHSYCQRDSRWGAILVAMLDRGASSLCWFRTHGLWLLWGLSFAWAVSRAVIFAGPVFGGDSFSSIVDTRATAQWLTGGHYGQVAAGISIVLVLAAIPILVRVTGDYAWEYTHPPMVPGGYDVTIAPPAAQWRWSRLRSPSPQPR